jgi:hypothetical protein
MIPSARARERLLLATLVGVTAATASASVPGFAPIRWTPLAETAAEDAPTALAADGAGRIAVGGMRGVHELAAEGMPESLLRRGPVLDLAFLADGSLLVATADGLYRVTRDGRSRDESLPTDALERAVLRLDAARGVAVAATGSGVFLRGRDAVWRRALALPSGATSLVALRAQGSALELWSAIDGELWIASLRPEAAEPWASVERVTLPMAPRSEAALDVGFDLPGGDAVLVYPSALVVRDAAGAWRSLRPSLPPGASASRIAVAFSRLWLATDAGLLCSARLEGPWERAVSPVGSLPIVDLAGGASLTVASHRGVQAAVAMAEATAATATPPVVTPAPPPALEPAPAGPSIAALQRAALRQQELEPERARDMWRRVRRRGWLPELEVSAAYVDQHDRGRDYDESFVSGDTRYLHDRSNDRGRDFDVVVSLTWELGDTVFNAEEIDVSRELRSVIALRDDVLDEVTQLYFERERVLSRLALAPPEDPERPALALRADELAASLDAWTGGAFTREPADDHRSR